MLEDINDPAEMNRLILSCVPAVIASMAARVMDPTAAVLTEVAEEQIAAAGEMGLAPVEFGLLKLQAAERVCVWLLNVLSDMSGYAHGDLLMQMSETVAEEGITGFFGGSEGR